MSILLAPSMLSADFGQLDKDVELVNEGAADWFHLDIMDGVFVPNISYGFPVVKAMAKKARKPLDAHLMIVDPDRYLANFAELGVEWLSVHYEACTHLHRTIQAIKALGMKAGVALNPHTSISLIEDIIMDVDYVLIMSVNPGFGGQKFIPKTLDKLRQAKKIIGNRDILLEIDGGINTENAPLVIEAGANVLVAGSSVFSASDPRKTIELLKTVK